VRPKAAAGGEPTRRTILRSISLTADVITTALVMVCVFALFGTPNGVAGLARSVRLGVVG
jgi:hypothetical protein